MSNSDDPAAGMKQTAWFWWLQGRAGRREYWASLGCLFAVGLAMEYFPGGPKLGSALSIVLMFLQIRRIHDFGRSGWWAVAGTFGPLPVAAVLAAASSLEVAVVATILLALALMILVGAIPGSAADNRFGPPPPFTARRVLTGR
jgi:uncharacterized membrane protein YhaH (DUF805 family)